MGKPYVPGRKSGDKRVNPRPNRQYGGRRKEDYDARTTVSKKLLVWSVFAGNLLYLIGDAILQGSSICQ